MVKFINATINIFITFIFSVAFVACNDDTLENLSPDNNNNECTLIFNLGTGSRGTEITSFNEGDKLFFYFKDPAKLSGTATFSANGKWKLTYVGTLTSGLSGLCNVIYSTNKELQLNEYGYFTLNSSDGLYGTMDGQWEYTDGTMTVYAHLRPLQTKISFVSSQPKEIMIKGIQPQSRFSVKSFSFWSYDDKHRPCYPQTIKIDMQTPDGKYSSADYYCVGLGTEFYQGYETTSKKGCQHYIYENSEYIYSPCTLGDYLYIYDKSNIQKCYRRSLINEPKSDISLVINIPSTTSHEGWEMIDNQIQTITGERRGVYINTGIKNTCGFSTNFSVKKNYYQSGDGLIAHFGSDYAFIMIGRNDNWTNHSATSYNENINAELYFTGRSGDASVDPYNYFKDITYSHFPYYDELIESWDDYR